MAYARAANDYYVEPEWSVDCLARVVLFDGVIWDPCCGSGTIPRVLRRAGYDRVVASDIVDRGAEGAFVWDFFCPELLAIQADHIVSNPPYLRLTDFIELALTRAAKSVAVLTGIRFLASQERYWLFKATPIKQVLILSRRPSMPPGDSSIKAQGGKQDYCWLVFDHNFAGPPRIDWIMPIEDIRRAARGRA